MAVVKIPDELREFEGFFPDSTVPKLFRVPREKLFQHFQRTGNGSKLEEAFWIPDVCQNPAGIWRGLERATQEKAYCFCGQPSGEFANLYFPGSLELPDGFVFMVFADATFEVSDWSLCRVCPDRAGFPIGHESRFGAQIWPTD